MTHSDFDSGDGTVGFFCMKLAGFILRDNADYLEEMGKAKSGLCSYKNECPIYRRSIKKHEATQLKILI